MTINKFEGRTFALILILIEVILAYLLEIFIGSPLSTKLVLKAIN